MLFVFNQMGLQVYKMKLNKFWKEKKHRYYKVSNDCWVVASPTCLTL